MDNFYLQELINETITRGGGIVLNMDEKPACVVLTIEKYNQLVSQATQQKTTEESSQITQSSFAKASADKSLKKLKVLVTGGAGYIGTHAVKELLNSGYEVIIIDNLSTGKRENLDERAKFYEGDLADVNFLRDIFAQEKINAVMHFAASLEVEESVSEPLKYLKNNLENTSKLLEVMNEFGVKKIVFSSTAAVYGNPKIVPVTENSETVPTNPYGLSKLLAEKCVEYYVNFLGFDAVVFRYFNACGSSPDFVVKPTHESHLLPIVLQTAFGKRPQITVYGFDYETHDGTCVRDYVHVSDIAAFHTQAMEKIETGEIKGFHVYNIGTGRGVSVLEMINTAAEVLNRMIPMEIGPRRPGDASITIADNSKLLERFGENFKYSDLETIIKTGVSQI